MYSRQHSFFFPLFFLISSFSSLRMPRLCCVVQPFHQIVFHFFLCLFFNVCPSLLIVSPVSFWLCQRGRVGKAAQLTPPSAAAPFRPLTPEVVRSGGSEHGSRRVTQARTYSRSCLPLRQLSDKPPARNGASTD